MTNEIRTFNNIVASHIQYRLNANNNKLNKRLIEKKKKKCKTRGSQIESI